MLKDDIFEYCRVKPGARVSLKQIDPAGHRFFHGDKLKAEKVLGRVCQELDGVQKLLYAGHQHKVLVVLQGIDASGKDGVVRHVFGGFNPQGVRVVSFKSPSTRELDHDYLWRVHNEVPAKGEIVVFNRSHYEDILIVRVHNMAPKSVWKKRFDHIRDFERMLCDEGTVILKFFLWIDQEEQQKRLEDRLKNPDKRWKFNPTDLEERKLWPDYIKAYEDMLGRTSTKDAPWYIVPADKKWYRNLVVAQTVLSALKRLKMRYPEPEGLEKVHVL